MATLPYVAAAIPLATLCWRISLATPSVDPTYSWTHLASDPTLAVIIGGQLARCCLFCHCRWHCAVQTGITQLKYICNCNSWESHAFSEYSNHSCCMQRHSTAIQYDHVIWTVLGVRYTWKKCCTSGMIFTIMHIFVIILLFKCIMWPEH